MREMKDSGVEWIGEIPKDWKLAQVRYLFRIGRGRVIAQTEIEENGIYPVFSSQTKNNGCLGYINTYDFDLEQITWTTDGANAGTVFLRNGKHNCTNVCGTLQPLTKKLNLRYQKYALEHIAFYHKRADTNGYKIMNNEMAAIQTIIPSYGEQEKIADYLDSMCHQIDDIIGKQQTIIEKLKEYKLSVINEAVTHGINPEVEMKDSGYKWIGDIPKHWNMVYAKQLFTQRKDRAYEEDEQLTSSQKYGIISQKVFMEIEGRQVMQVLKGEEILKHVEKGDFVISMRSFQGGLEYSEVSGKISSAYVMLIPNKAKVYDRYYKWLFKSKRYISALQGTSNLIRDGQALRFSNFIQVYLPNFNMDEQKQIADYLDKICPKLDAEVEKREKLLEKMNEYKKALIYEVVTGKKEV